jgi:hypothetical protein
VLLVAVVAAALLIQKRKKGTMSWEIWRKNRTISS